MHEIEILDGLVSMAYVGELPWHGLGKKVPADLTPEQMCAAAGLNWEVEKRDATIELNGKPTLSGSGSLVRLVNGKNVKQENILTSLPQIDKWNPVQNEDAFAFFNEFVAAGDMEMHTAGSLKDGRIVWALAKMKNSFEAVKGDEIESYLLFSNPHEYSKAINVRFTPTRVVCHNTLSIALGEDAVNYSSSHRVVFDPEAARQKLGLAKYNAAQYQEKAEFLASKRYTADSIIDYFNAAFPVKRTKESDKPLDASKAAKFAIQALEVQPGNEFAPGSWWQAFNASTFYLNHVSGRSQENRLNSLFYGENARLGVRSLDLAVQFAEAA